MKAAQPLPPTFGAPTGGGDTWTYTWADQPRFYTDNNNERQEYIYKVTELSLEIDPADGSFTSSECVIVDGVYTITNTYKLLLVTTI